MFEKPDLEVKNAEWEIKRTKGSFEIKHRKKGSKLKDLDATDIKSLASLLPSTVLAMMREQ